MNRVALALLSLALVRAAEGQTSCPAAPQFTIVSSCSPVPSEGPVPCQPGTAAAFHLAQRDSARTPLKLDACQSVTWEFGDGSTVTTSRPDVTHTYATSGHRTVRATVNSSGGSSTMGAYILAAAGWIEHWDTPLPLEKGNERWNTEGREQRVEFIFRRNSTEGTASFEFEATEFDPNAKVRYVPTIHNVTFEPGQRVARAYVTLVDDQVYRGNFPLVVRYTPQAGWAYRSGQDPGVTATIVADDDLPVLRFASDTFRGSESSGTVPMTLEISGEYTVPIKFSYYLRDPGRPDSSWTPRYLHDLIIPAGAKTQTYPIPAGFANDKFYQGDRETSIEVVSYEAVAPKTRARLILEDDDPIPILSIDDVTTNEGTGGQNGIRNLIFKARISHPLQYETTFTVRFEPGTADASDVWWPNGKSTVSLLAGATEVPLSIGVRTDNVPEPDESFTIVAENSGRLPVIGRGRATITLVNDDTTAAISPPGASVLVGEKMQLTLALPQPVTNTTTFALQNSAPSVLSAPASVTIPAGSNITAFDVHGLTTGTTRLTATAGSTQVQADLTVITYQFKFREPLPLRVIRGTEYEVGLEITPAPASSYTLTAHSSDPAIATGTVLYGFYRLQVRAFAVGKATITLRTPAGAIATTVPVEVFERLSVRQLTPASGPLRGGTAVTLTGNGFHSGCEVFFGGVLAPPREITATTLVVTSPAHAAGRVTVGVRCLPSQSSVLPNAFLYTDGGGKSRSVRH